MRFYNQEIKIREKLNYPPFCDIIIAVIIGKNEAEVIEDANKIYTIFGKVFEIYAPMPAPIAKINENYRWRVLMKAKIDDSKIDTINYCLADFDNQKHKDTKLSFDINPNNMS